MFKLFRWLFTKQFDNYILDRTLRTGITKLSNDQHKYLLKLKEEGMMIGILDRLIATFVKAGLQTRTVDAREQMGDWIGMVSYLKDLINNENSTQQKLNPLTQAPYKNPNDTK